VIFVTVGHQMPFDRLVHAVDAWAEREGRADIFAQIGSTRHWPRYIQAAPFLTPAQFRQRMEQASTIVAHAGTGTIIAAVRLRKPLLVLPRHASLNETRNDHQIATAKHFEQAGHIMAAYDEDELIAKLSTIESFTPTTSIDDTADESLLRRLREFTFGAAHATPRDAEASSPSLAGRG